jgi:hypothetical protein
MVEGRGDLGQLIMRPAMQWGVEVASANAPDLLDQVTHRSANQPEADEEEQASTQHDQH